MRHVALMVSLLWVGGLHVALAQAAKLGDRVIRDGSQGKQSASQLFAESEPTHYALSPRRWDAFRPDMRTLKRADEDTFATYAFTFGDIVIFSYRNDNFCRVLNAAGDVIWSDTLMLDDYALVSSLAPEVYQIMGNKEFSVLSGDPFNRGVCCWYAVDETSHPLSTKLLSVGPKDFSMSQNIIAVFSYYDNTHVVIRDIKTKALIWEGDLDSAEHYIQDKKYNPPVAFSVEATKPVSAGTFSGVVGTYAPSFNATFTGRDFMTYYHNLDLDPQDMNIIPWEDSTRFVVTNLDDPSDTIWMDFCAKRGEVKGRSMPTGIAVYVHADKDISVSQTPWASYGGPSNARPAYLARGIDRDGLGLGQEFFVPLVMSAAVVAQDSTRLHIIAYEDTTQVKLARIPRLGGNETTLWQGTLDKGEFYLYTCPGGLEGWGTYHVTSSKPVSAIGSYAGIQGSDFLPLWFAIHPSVAALPDQYDETECLWPVHYTVYVENNGNFWDVINIFTANSDSANFTTAIYDSLGGTLADVDSDGNPDTDTLPKGGDCLVLVDVSPADMIPFGNLDTCFFSVQSFRDPRKLDTAYLVTRIREVNIGVGELGTDTFFTSAPPREWAYLDLYGINTSKYRADTVNLTWPSPNKDTGIWSIRVTEVGSDLSDHDGDGVPDLVDVMPDREHKDFRMRMYVPDTALAQDTAVIYFVGTSANYPLGPVYPESIDTAVVLVGVEPVPGIQIVPDTMDSTFSGWPISYPLIVYNNGNGPDVADIRFRTDKLSWTHRLLTKDGVTFLADTDQDGVPDVGSLPAQTGFDTLMLEVTPPYAAPSGELDSTIVTARSSVDTLVYDTAIVVTRTRSRVSLDIEPDTGTTIGPGEDAVYYLRVTNWGGAPDTVAIGSYASPLLGWSYKLTNMNAGALVDLDGDGTPDVGSLDSAETETVRLVLRPHESLGSIIGAFDTAVTETRYVWIRTHYRHPDSLRASDSVTILTRFEPLLDIHNYPNPFSGSTTFAYSIPRAGHVTLRIYNRAGEHIKTLIDELDHAGGLFEIAWDGLTESGRRPAPGVYLYSLEWRADDAAGFIKTKRIVKKALLQP